MLPCLQYPTTHYCANNVPTGDNGVISGNPYTWIAKDNTNGPIKSIYDPCPYGYRVPKDGSWANWTNPHTQKWTDGDIKGGVSLQSTWWPAAGYRSYGSATMTGVATGGWCWSSSPHPSYAYQSYRLFFDYGGSVNPSYGNYRSYGFSLRCIQE